MYAHELFEAGKPNIVVTYPGRFQPFHQGHAAVFAKLQKQYGSENVYILTSNDAGGPKSPFNFSDKYQLITAAGIPGDRIIETNGMYALPEQFETLDFQHFYLQPMDGPHQKLNTQKAIEYCLLHPKWNLSMQTHKYLNIP